MATLNKIVSQYTHEGAKARNISVVSQLERSVMSCLLWEDNFYEDGVSIAQRIEELSAKVPVDDLVRIIVQAKNDMRLRHVPLLLACNLVKRKEGRSEFKNVAEHIFTRPDDITEFLTLYWKDGRKPLAKCVKRYLGEVFRKFDEYQLAKYNGGKKAVKLRDAMRVTHPKPHDDNQSALWGRLINGELKTPDTWEVSLSASNDKKAVWERMLSENKLGGLALLRNIRNMVDANVDAELIKKGIEGINAGRLLPINFISAAKHNPRFEPILEKKFFECFTGKAKIEGLTVLLVDVSNSMTWDLSDRSKLTRLDVAHSLAMIAREMFDNLVVVTFSNIVVEVPPRRGFALKDAINTSQPNGGTALGAAIHNIPVCDRLIVITDEQSSDRVPDRDGYMINVASHKNGVGYGMWKHIDGWSDKVLDYIVKYESRNVTSLL